MATRAIIFDLDGTLYPMYQIFLPTFSLIVRHVRFVVAFRRVRKIIRSMRPIENLMDLQAELLAQELRVTTSRAKNLIDTLIYGAWMRSFRGISPYPDLTQTLRSLKDRGFRLGVLSDLPVDLKLEYLGLTSVWDCALSSESTNYLKPNPEPFLYAADLIGVDPTSVMFVGNSYQYDIIGAHRMGMGTAHFARRRVAAGIADHTFSRYEDFPELYHPT